MSKPKNIENNTLDSKKLINLSNYIIALHQAENLDQCWEIINEQLARFGFDRVLYARKPHANIENTHNLFDVVMLSSLGDEYNKELVSNPDFVRSYNVRWVMDNTGWLSWREIEERYIDDQMDEIERTIQEINIKHGITHGITYTGTTQKSSYQSAFRMCFRDGFDHDHVESVWKDNESEITSYLYVFDILTSIYPHVPVGCNLTEKQRTVLKLAAKGYTISTITEITGWHRRTVDNHMAAARERLQVANTLQAVMKAALQGQI